jgi:hypothetical protein
MLKSLSKDHFLRVFEAFYCPARNPMLDHTADLERQVNFAVDMLGLATRYDFTVLRWGVMVHAGCIVSPEGKASHEKWLAMDIELLNDDLADQFATDALMAGIYVKRLGLILHCEPKPISPNVGINIR